MKPEESMDVVRGTGNVFRDLGSKNPDADQFKSILATDRTTSVVQRFRQRWDITLHIQLVVW